MLRICVAHKQSACVINAIRSLDGNVAANFPWQAAVDENHPEWKKLLVRDDIVKCIQNTFHLEGAIRCRAPADNKGSKNGAEKCLDHGFSKIVGMGELRRPRHVHLKVKNGAIVKVPMFPGTVLRWLTGGGTEFYEYVGSAFTISPRPRQQIIDKLLQGFRQVKLGACQRCRMTDMKYGQPMTCSRPALVNVVQPQAYERSQRRGVIEMLKQLTTPSDFANDPESIALLMLHCVHGDPPTFAYKACSDVEVDTLPLEAVHSGVRYIVTILSDEGNYSEADQKTMADAAGFTFPAARAGAALPLPSAAPAGGLSPG